MAGTRFFRFIISPDGISTSRPPFAAAIASYDVQSDMMTPSNPHSFLTMSLLMAPYCDMWCPLTRLYEVMTAPTCPSFTAASNAARAGVATDFPSRALGKIAIPGGCQCIAPRPTHPSCSSSYRRRGLKSVRHVSLQNDESGMTITSIDIVIIAMYVVCVLGIGFVLRRRVHDSTDFFLAGRSIPAWTAGLAFLSANLGAQEMIGMAASGAKYGILTSHFYWVGAIPAMVFVGVFMMPFYYGSRARSVPEYLKLRFDEKTRGFNAITFAVMTVFSSGISMYAMGALLSLLLGWDFNVSVFVAAVVVLAYIFLGGLTSAIYNEVLQFFLIVFGFAPVVYLGLREIGGWSGLAARVPSTFVHAWANLGDPAANPMGVEWFGLVMGLGFVLSFGYWCTDFLVVQRAMAADSMNAARLTPLIAAIPKMMFPFLVIVPGIIALALSASAAPGGATLLPLAPN